jgi:hypothetical protein
VTQQPEDRDWDRLLERLDCDVSAEDLAAAERAMCDIDVADVPPVATDGVDAVIAKATTPPVVDGDVEAAEGEREAPLAPVHSGWWSGLKKLAAAVLAFVAAHGYATAATVAVVGGGVVLVSLYWPEGVNSFATMSYEEAILILGREGEPVDAQEAALFELTRHIGECILLLKQAASTQAPADQAEAVKRLAQLQQLLDLAKPVGGPTVPIDNFAARLDASREGSVADLWVLSDLTANGVLALRNAQDLRIARDRDLHVRWLEKRSR